MSGYRVNFRDGKWIIEKSDSPRAQTKPQAQAEAARLNRERQATVKAFADQRR